MPIGVAERYTQASLIPYKWPEIVLREDYPVAANQVIALGATVAQVTAANATCVQTFANTATGGTFTLTFGNALQYTTTALNCTSLTAAQLQAALQALPNIGAGGCTVAGTAFSSGAGSLVVTFAGSLANQPQPLMTVNNTLAAGGTVTATLTTTGVQNGALVNYNNAITANPTTAPTLGTATTGGTWNPGGHQVAYTFVTGAGETLPSYPAELSIPTGTSTNTITVTSITGIPSYVTAVNFYVNGVFAKAVAPTSGATGAVTITGPAAATSATPAPRTNTAYQASDGSQIPIGFAWYTMAAAPNGQITDGNTAPIGNSYQVPSYTGNVAVRGFFSCASLNSGAGVDQNTVNLLGRLLHGGLTTGVLVIS